MSSVFPGIFYYRMSYFFFIYFFLFFFIFYFFLFTTGTETVDFILLYSGTVCVYSVIESSFCLLCKYKYTNTRITAVFSLT